MINNREKFVRYLFYFSWIILSCLQAYFTELIPDESYYWMYAQFLDWGYFDHPPAIALAIKIGVNLFGNNELGVRFIPILLITLTFFVIEKIIRPKNYKLFYIILTSVGVIHFIGIFALPDAPLLFFTSCTLLIYKKFLEKQNIVNALLLGLFTALMFYSKYHAILLVLSVILSNLKLLKNKYFLISIILFSLLMLPHLFWQINNNFPSLKYHVQDRIKSLNFTAPLEYFISQPFILGPVTGILFFIAAFRKKITNQFNKTLKYAYLFAYLFFLIYSLMGRRVEAHWTLITFIPGVCLLYQFIEESKNKKILKALRYGFYFTILIVLVFKIYLIYDFLPRNKTTSFFLGAKFHDKKQKAFYFKSLSKGLPVIFPDSYQIASLYNFYNQCFDATVISSIQGRKSQYDYFGFEKKLRGKKIMYFPNGSDLKYNQAKENYIEPKKTIISNYQSYNKIELIPKNQPDTIKQRHPYNLSVLIKSNYNYPINFELNKKLPAQIKYIIFKDGDKIYKSKPLLEITNNMIETIQKIRIHLPNHLKRGLYSISYSVNAGLLPSTINSKRFRIYIK